ncbi:MAG: methyl-accepting chemotaxis protein, partial [bacterium]
MFQRLGLTSKIFLVTAIGLIVSFVAMFYMNKVLFENNLIHGLVVKARAITTEAENARNYVADLRGVHKAFNDQDLFKEAIPIMKKAKRGGFRSREEHLKAVRKTRIYWTVPIVAGWVVGQTNAQQSNFRFKVPKVQPRNPKNKPTKIENFMLDQLKQKNISEFVFLDKKSNVLRYMRPVRLTKECLVCHGTLADDKDKDGLDPFGFKMEGWKKGEIHGAFEVIADLAPIQKKVRSSLVQTLLVMVVTLFVILFILYFVLRRSLAQPIQKLSSVIQDLGQGNLDVRVDIQTQDEIGSISHEIDIYADNIKSVIESVSNNTNLVFQSSHELKRNAEMMFASTERVKSQTYAIGQGSEKITENV